MILQNTYDVNSKINKILSKKKDITYNERERDEEVDGLLVRKEITHSQR